jgi:hypothetical protein
MSCGCPSVAYNSGAFCFNTNVVFYLNMGQKTRRKLAVVQEDAGLETLARSLLIVVLALLAKLKEAYRATQREHQSPRPLSLLMTRKIQAEPRH